MSDNIRLFFQVKYVMFLHLLSLQILWSAFSVYEKFYTTRAKVALVNLIYGSHFFATEATYEVSQNIENFVESIYIQEVDVSQSYFM